MGNASGKPHQVVDGGKLVPNGIYSVAAQDYDNKIVQQLIIQRLLSPFYLGAEDPDPSDKASQNNGNDGATGSKVADDGGWWSYKLHVAALAREMDDKEGGGESGPSTSTHRGKEDASHIQSGKKGTFDNNKLSTAASHQPSTSHTSLTAGDPDKRRRALKSIDMSAVDVDYDMINGNSNSDSSKLKLKRTVECPICFLYYPSNINYSHCCHKPICTECFVQIKRHDELLSPAHCPYCVEPDFGVIYYPPMGLAAINDTKATHKKTKIRRPSLQSASKASSMQATRKRSNTTANRVPLTIMSDDIRPNLLKQLAIAKEKREREELRRSAAFAIIAASTQRSNQEESRQESGDDQRPALQSMGNVLSLPGRRGNRSQGGVRVPSEYGNYLAAMRTSGGQSFEEFLIQEAIRQSLEDVEPHVSPPRTVTQQQGNGDSTGQSGLLNSTARNSITESATSVATDNGTESRSQLASDHNEGDHQVSNPAEREVPQGNGDVTHSGIVANGDRTEEVEVNSDLEDGIASLTCNPSQTINSTEISKTSSLDMDCKTTTTTQSVETNQEQRQQCYPNRNQTSSPPLIIL